MVAGNSVTAHPGGEGSIRVDELLVRHAQVGQIGDGPGVEAFVDAEEAHARVLVAGPLEVRQLCPARHAPGRPHVEHRRPVETRGVELVSLLIEAGERRQDDVWKRAGLVAAAAEAVRVAGTARSVVTDQRRRLSGATGRWASPPRRHR